MVSRVGRNVKHLATSRSTSAIRMSVGRIIQFLSIKLINVIKLYTHFRSYTASGMLNPKQ